jgi:anti-anti-sigma factor
MLILVESRHDVAILRISTRDLTLHDHATFSKALEPYLSHHSNLLLDMDDVQTIDGYGIGILLDCRNQLRQKGGDLKLMNVNEAIRDYFEIARVHRLFEFHRSLPAALASFTDETTPLHSDNIGGWQTAPGIAD